jgi:Thioesterase-like superfamily
LRSATLEPRIGLCVPASSELHVPVIGDALAKFRHDLKVFQTFEIHTRLIGWDSKWGFFEHRFVRKDRVIGVVAGGAVLKAPDGLVDPQVILADMAHSAPSPELPEWAKRFDQGQNY